MKTAQEYAQIAAQIALLANQMKPESGNPYFQAQDLIRYYLQRAAAKTREIAKAIASKEGPA